MAKRISTPWAVVTAGAGLPINGWATATAPSGPGRPRLSDGSKAPAAPGKVYYCPNANTHRFILNVTAALLERSGETFAGEQSPHRPRRRGGARSARRRVNFPVPQTQGAIRWDVYFPGVRSP